MGEGWEFDEFEPAGSAGTTGTGLQQRGKLLWERQVWTAMSYIVRNVD